MKIKHIAINNFLSYQKEEIDFTKFDGLTVIKGKNLDTGGSNGSGKSALIEAIYFGLTGKTIRKTTEASLVNSQVGTKCSVVIDIEHDGKDIQILRSKRPTKLRLWVDGEEVTADHARNTQARIEEILNTNPRVLLASMFFGQSNDTNFLDATADEKRDIIKNFLNLDDIFQMRERIRGYKSEYNSRIKFNEKLIERNSRAIRDLEQDIESLSNYKPSGTVADYETAWEFYHTTKADIAACTTSRDRVAAEIRKGQQTECPTCGQELDTQASFEMIESKKKDLHLLEDTLQDLQSKLVKPDLTIAEVTRMMGMDKQDVLEDQITKLKRENDECMAKAQEARQQYDVMRFWEKALSESGVIKYIIRNVLEYFNNKCNYYLGYLTDSLFRIEFDDELSEIIHIGKVETAYITLSGGEKRKVNLAVMMALKDLLIFTDKNHSNILFLDEVAENIDESGVAGLYNLMLELKKTRNLFVITHNRHLKNMLESSPRITIEKKDGVSKLWQTQN